MQGSLDELAGAVVDFAEAEAIPGFAVLAKRGRETLLESYWGRANKETGIPVGPETRFRLASVSKPITARAVTALVAAGKLGWDEKLFEIIDGIKPRGDPRLTDITVRHLVHHGAGWDRSKSFEPVYSGIRIAKALKLDRAPSFREACAYIARRKLQFAPGTGYAYSNIGYAFLGLVIEARGGRPYEEFVRDTVLAPVALENIGFLRSWTPQPDEARGYYHDARGRRVPVDVFFKDCPRCDPYIHAANGGWIASAQETMTLIQSADRETVARRPDFAPSKTNYYGRGWQVFETEKGQDLVHVGRLPGTFAVALSRADGLDIAMLFNANPGDHHTTGNQWVARLRSLG